LLGVPQPHAGSSAQVAGRLYLPLVPRASALTAAPPGSAVILAGRGRVANVRATSFTVLWTTDAETTGRVLYGPAAVLGSTAADVRGGAVPSQTHYVDVTGLQPSTTYFFDVQSGGAVDSNVGQHYQIRTGPELGPPPSSNAVVGSVLNPGGGSPAGGALVWATVRDGNGDGTGGAAQLLATLAGPDGRFRLGLQPRVPDLSAYFVYQNRGDLLDLVGTAATGEVSGTIGTEITADGGTAPAEVRMILSRVAAAATAAPPPPAAVPSPTPTPSPLAQATVQITSVQASSEHPGTTPVVAP
jgi:hypothetical protein